MSGTLQPNNTRHHIIRLQQPSFVATATVTKAAQAQLTSIKKARGERRKRQSKRRKENGNEHDS